MHVALLTVLIDLIGFGIIIPVQPFYAESFGASPTLVTLLGTAYSGMQFLFAPMWGRLSDRRGRRPVMLISIAITLAGYLIFAFASSLWMLFLARMLSGFGAANIGAAQAIVADVTTGDDRARGMGLIGAAFGIGFVIGPAIGGAMGQISAEATALTAAGLSALNFLFAWRSLPETRRAGSSDAVHRGRGFAALRDLRTAGQYVNVPRLLLIIAVMITGMALMEQSISLFIEHVWVLGEDRSLAGADLGDAAGLTAIVLLAVGVVAAVIQGGFTGKLTKRFGEVRLAQVGAIIAAVALGLFAVVGAVGVFALMVLVAAFLACGTSLLMPSTNALLSRAVPEDVQGTYLGLGQSLSALGRTIGPAFAGLLFELNPSSPLVASAVLMAVAFVVTLGLSQPTNVETDAVSGGQSTGR